MSTFDLAVELRAIADGLTALDGVRRCSTDAADVLLPGVWVTCTGWQRETLKGGLVLDLDLVLLVDNTTHARALTDLSDLYAVVSAVYPPTGRVTPRVVSVGGDDDDPRLPGLSIPTRVRWTP